MRRFRMGFHGRNQLFARYNDAASIGGEGAAPKHIKVRRNHSCAFYSIIFIIPDRSGALFDPVEAS